MHAEQVTPQLVAEVVEGPQAQVLRLFGELDFAAQARMETLIAECEQRGRHLLIDLRELTFIDSAGLRLLLTANWRARAAGRKLSVTRANASVRRMLELTGLDAELDEVDPGAADALARAPRA